jgi:hypothetical protein
MLNKALKKAPLNDSPDLKRAANMTLLTCKVGTKARLCMLNKALKTRR